MQRAILYLVALAVASTAAIGAQTASKKLTLAELKPFHAQFPGKVITEEQLTIAGSRFTEMHQTVDCPNCKDLFCYTFSPSSGRKIAEAVVVARRPTANNHWYRCQIESSCGRPEFSNPKNATQGCTGLTSCNLCRAVDGSTPGVEDDIIVRSVPVAP